MEDLLFERLERMNTEVEPEIVLQDLYFVDRVVRPVAGPEDPEYRIPFLLEALESRRFCPTVEARWEVVEVYDDLCELCEIGTYEELSEVLERYRVYHRSNTTAVEDR